MASSARSKISSCKNTVISFFNRGKSFSEGLPFLLLLIYVIPLELIQAARLVNICNQPHHMGFFFIMYQLTI